MRNQKTFLNQASNFLKHQLVVDLGMRKLDFIKDKEQIADRKKIIEYLSNSNGNCLALSLLVAHGHQVTKKKLSIQKEEVQSSSEKIKIADDIAQVEKIYDMIYNWDRARTYSQEQTNEMEALISKVIFMQVVDNNIWGKKLIENEIPIRIEDTKYGIPEYKLIYKYVTEKSLTKMLSEIINPNTMYVFSTLENEAGHAVTVSSYDEYNKTLKFYDPNNGSSNLSTLEELAKAILYNINQVVPESGSIIKPLFIITAIFKEDLNENHPLYNFPEQSIIQLSFDDIEEICKQYSTEELLDNNSGFNGLVKMAFNEQNIINLLQQNAHPNTIKTLLTYLSTDVESVMSENLLKCLSYYAEQLNSNTDKDNNQGNSYSNDKNNPNLDDLLTPIPQLEEKELAGEAEKTIVD